MTDRETQLADTLVTLADTLVGDFDAADFMYLLVDRCKELLDVDEAGLVLSDPAGSLMVVASTSERTRLLEVFQVQSEEGPCYDAYHTGRRVITPDLSTEEAEKRWPGFTGAARHAGFTSVTALPMRLRNQVIGALNLLQTTPGALPDIDLNLAQALADVATIGLLQERAIRDGQLVITQLQNALNSRVVIEQAKGFIAQTLDISPGEAFDLLRLHARSHNHQISTLAKQIVNGTYDLEQLPVN